MENFDTSFHVRLENLRLEKGWSPYKLSCQAGLGKGAVTDLLAATDRIPRKGTIKKLAAALDVSHDYLLGKTDIKAGNDQRNMTRPGKFGKELQRVIAAIVEFNGDNACLVSLEKPIPALGLEAGAVLVITKGHGLETGDLVAVQIGEEFHVCCIAGQALVSLSGLDSIGTSFDSENIRIIGHLEYAGTSKLGENLQILGDFSNNR